METPDAVTVVLDQVATYNDRDLGRILEYYADDAVILDANGRVMDEGREAIHAVFAQVFAQNPNLNAAVPQVIHVGEWVTIHSIVPDWVMRDGSRQEMQWIEVYQVVDGKIRRLQLFR